MNTKQSPNYLIIKYEFDSLDTSCASSFKKTVCEQIGTGCKTVILDLCSVQFIDSSGLGAIVEVFKTLQVNGKLLLCGVGNNVLRLLKLTRLDSIFMLYPDVDSAVQAIEHCTRLNVCQCNEQRRRSQPLAQRQLMQQCFSNISCTNNV